MPLYNKEKFLKKIRSQATIEYLILFTSIITVLIIFLGNKSSFFAKSYNSSLYRASNSIDVRVNSILQKVQ